jgi:acetolactate synthase I/II/III large subunit
VKHTGAELVVRALEDEGVPFTFGIPGTHNIELYDALADSRVRTVLVTDEQSASFMADAVWRASGKLGCASVVPGAGLTHAMSGIAEAYMDNVPMLVLGCGIRRDTGMAYQLHDVDQAAMVRPVTKAQFLPVSGEELYETVREACRTAREGVPGPVFVEVPANMYLFRHDARLPAAGRGGPPPKANLAAGASSSATTSSPPESIARAAALLSSARRPLLYLGLGAAPAGTDALIELAERLGSPVATTFQGKGVFPESHPLALWPGFGDAAPPFARKIAGECDATLAIGCRFGEVATGSYGISPPGKLIHIDIDPDVPGRNYPADIAIVGDSRELVPALLAALAPRTEPELTLRDRIRSGRAEVREQRLRASSSSRVTPARLLESLQRLLGPDTIFTTDSGNGTFLAVEILQLNEPGKLLAPVDYSCMGYAVPAAIGARLARPDAPVVALAGDGALLMTGLELLTAATYGIPVLVCVLRDGELAQIAQFQRAALVRTPSSTIVPYDSSALFGSAIEIMQMRSDAEIEDVLARASQVIASGRPAVIDVAIDYSEKTWFTRGVVKTNLLRLPWGDRLRFVGRALGRRLIGTT